MTFHIQPHSALAHEAADLVREFAPDTFVAIRGEIFDGVEEVYTVCGLDREDHPSRYEWKYVLAGEWLADYAKQSDET